VVASRTVAERTFAKVIEATERSTKNIKEEWMPAPIMSKEGNNITEKDGLTRTKKGLFNGNCTRKEQKMKRLEHAA
jgi:hypothetical protein